MRDALGVGVRGSLPARAARTPSEREAVVGACKGRARRGAGMWGSGGASGVQREAWPLGSGLSPSAIVGCGLSSVLCGGLREGRRGAGGGSETRGRVGWGAV